MSKHTPGPWSVTADSHCHIVVDVEGHELHIGTNEANARLIAAAPDLLGALIDCRRALEIANFTQELAVVDAAIAKATGDQA